MLLFILIMMGYAVIKVFFANLKRGGILLIQIAVGSLYMFSVPRGYMDGFVSWCKQIIGLCLTGYNLLFWIIQRKKANPSDEWVVRIIFWQITIDLIALTLLLYFSGISHNPFIFYFIFHIIIAAILLPEPVAYFQALLASLIIYLPMSQMRP